MRLSEMITVIMIVSIIFTTLGSSFLAMRTMESNIRSTITQADMPIIIAQILEPFLKCSDLSRATFNNEILQIELTPCFDVIQIQPHSKNRYEITIVQPEYRQTLIPYEWPPAESNRPFLRFENGCIVRITQFFTSIHFQVETLFECHPSLGNAFPFRPDGSRLVARFKLDRETLLLELGFLENRGRFRRIPELTLPFPRITAFNWTFRVLSRAFLVPGGDSPILQYDLDGNDNRRLDLNESPVRRPYPIEWVDGLNLFVIHQSNRPLADSRRCGRQKIKAGERKRCIVIRLRKPV